MKNTLKFDNLPSSYTEDSLGEGQNGHCFKLDDNTAFKLLDSPRVFEDCIKRLSKIRLSSFVFPRELVYVKDKFVGYTMDFIDGVLLDNAKYAPLDKYLREIRKLEYDIAALSLKKIYTLDLKPRNVLYSFNDGVKVIDTDFYCHSNRKNVYQINLYNLSSTILHPIMDVYDIDFESRDLNNKKELLNSGKYLPSKFLLDVLKELRKEIDFEIDNTTAVKTALELIRK